MYPKPSSIRIQFLLLLVVFFFLIQISQSSTKPDATTRPICFPNQTLMAPPTQIRNPNPSKKVLRRLPHVFGKTLELPLDSEAEVTMEEHPLWFRYIAETEVDLGEVRARVVDVHPGVKKVIVLGVEEEVGEDENWGIGEVRRVRLPEEAMPEFAKAVFQGRTLVVTVPKKRGLWRKGCGEGRACGGGGGGGGFSHENDLVLVC